MKSTGEVRVNAGRQNHYHVLEVELFASEEAIRRSYRRLVRRWHPDTNPSPEATARTATLNIARQVLLDPLQRETYDRELRLRLGRSAPASGAARPDRRSEPSRQPGATPNQPKPGRTSTTGKRTSAGAKKSSKASVGRAQGAAAREPEPKPPRDERLAWEDTRFVAGHAYRSRAGIFEVIEIRDRIVDIRYGDGSKLSLARHPLWEQWQRIARREQHAGDTTRPADEPPFHQTIRERVLAGCKERPTLDAVVAAGELLFAVGWATTTDMRASGGGYWVLPAPPNEVACDRLLRDMKAQGIALEQGMLAGGAKPGEKRPAWFYRPPADTADPRWL